MKKTNCHFKSKTAENVATENMITQINLFCTIPLKPLECILEKVIVQTSATSRECSTKIVPSVNGPLLAPLVHHPVSWKPHMKNSSDGQCSDSQSTWCIRLPSGLVEIISATSGQEEVGLSPRPYLHMFLRQLRFVSPRRPTSGVAYYKCKISYSYSKFYIPLCVGESTNLFSLADRCPLATPGPIRWGAFGCQLAEDAGVQDQLRRVRTDVDLGPRRSVPM